jgi:hypothetical protein
MNNKGEHAMKDLRITGLALTALLALTVAAQAQADTVYTVSIDTTSLLGTASGLTFDFIAGGGTQTNTLTISNFSTDGTLTIAGQNTGFVVGTLPGPVTFSTASFFNEDLPVLTLGTKISFKLDATTNAPNGSPLPDTFSLFLLDPTGQNSLITTTDPTGADALFTLAIGGSQNGMLGVYGSTPDVSVSVMHAAVPLPASIILLLSGITGFGFVGVRKRRTVN